MTSKNRRPSVVAFNDPWRYSTGMWGTISIFDFLESISRYPNKFHKRYIGADSATTFSDAPELEALTMPSSTIVQIMEFNQKYQELLQSTDLNYEENMFNLIRLRSQLRPMYPADPGLLLERPISRDLLEAHGQLQSPVTQLIDLDRKNKIRDRYF